MPSVGGLVTVLSNRDFGSRYSVYSDVLLDWPMELDEHQALQLTDKFDLQASGENDRYSVSQISPGYYNMNFVAFYLLKGRLLIAFYEVEGGTNCVTFHNLEPDQIVATLNEKFGFPINAMCFVLSAREGFSQPASHPNAGYELAVSLFLRSQYDVSNTSRGIGRRGLDRVD